MTFKTTSASPCCQESEIMSLSIVFFAHGRKCKFPVLTRTFSAFVTLGYWYVYSSFTTRIIRHLAGPHATGKEKSFFLTGTFERTVLRSWLQLISQASRSLVFKWKWRRDCPCYVPIPAFTCSNFQRRCLLNFMLKELILCEADNLQRCWLPECQQRLNEEYY